jgi:MFS family permease
MSLQSPQARPAPVAEAGQPPASAARRWAIVAMIMLLMIINFADKTVYGLAGKSLMDDLGLTQSQFGLGGSIFFLLFGVAAVIVGFVGNRVSSTKVLLVLAVAWSVSLGPLLLAPALGTLLLSRLLLGAAEGPTMPMAVHAVHKWFPESKRSMPTSMIPVGAALGVALSAPVLTFLIADHGWAVAFWILAALGPIWAVAWLLVGREGPFSTYASASDLADSTAVAGPEKHLPYRRIFGASGWWGPVLACAPAYVAFTAFNIWGPVYLEDGLGYSAGAIGGLIGTFAVIALGGMIAASWVSGRLVRHGVPTRWSRSAITGGGVVLSGVLILAGLGLDNGLTVWLLIVGFGLANATNPVGMLTVSEMSPVRQRSAILAVYNSLLTLGGVIASFGVGVLADRALGAGGTAVAGYELAFQVIALTMVVGGALAAWLTNAHRDAIRLGLQKDAAQTVATATA